MRAEPVGTMERRAARMGRIGLHAGFMTGSMAGGFALAPDRFIGRRLGC